MRKVIAIAIAIIFLLMLSFLFGDSGFNKVHNKNLERSDYSFDDFRMDFMNGDVFLCVDNMEKLGQFINFKDSWALNIDKNSDVWITHMNSGRMLDINKTNFEIFRQSFIFNESLQYEAGNQSPVKFLNINPSSTPNENLIFYASAGDYQKMLPNTQFDNELYFYAYNQKSIGDDKYVLLGSKPYVDFEIDSDKEYILGWVKYIEDNQPVNIQPIRTNLGIRPKLDYAGDFVVYENEKMTKILLDENDIQRYLKKYKDTHGQLNCWYPLLTDSTIYNDIMPIGIIDDSIKTVGYVDNYHGYFNIDVRLGEWKLRMLKSANNTFVQGKSMENFRFMLRQLVTGFYEIDFFLVTDELLQQTTISDFYEQIFGNRELVQKLIPEFFESNKTLYELTENMTAEKLHILDKNLQFINEQMVIHLNPPYNGRVTKVIKPAMNTYSIYYWIDINEVNIFKGLCNNSDNVLTPNHEEE